MQATVWPLNLYVVAVTDYGLVGPIESSLVVVVQRIDGSVGIVASYLSSRAGELGIGLAITLADRSW